MSCESVKDFRALQVSWNQIFWTTALNCRVCEAQVHSVWLWSHARSPDVGHCGICSQSGSWRTISTIAFRLARGRALSFKNEGSVVRLSVQVSLIKLTAALCWCTDAMHTFIFQDVSRCFNIFQQSLYFFKCDPGLQGCLVSARASHDCPEVMMQCINDPQFIQTLRIFERKHCREFEEQEATRVQCTCSKFGFDGLHFCAGDL